MTFDEEAVEDLYEKIEINHDFYFGGFAKKNEELIEFIQNFYESFKIKLDPLYTSKPCLVLLQKHKEVFSLREVKYSSYILEDFRGRKALRKDMESHFTNKKVRQKRSEKQAHSSLTLNN